MPASGCIQRPQPIAFTVVFAFGAGSAAGYVIKLVGAKSTAYEDDEFLRMSPVTPNGDNNENALVTASSPLT